MILFLFLFSVLHQYLTGLFIGCLKHGFLALHSITQDLSLPFNQRDLEAHIRKVFLYGCADTLPAALDELRDRESAGEVAEEWNVP